MARHVVVLGRSEATGDSKDSVRNNFLLSSPFLPPLGGEGRGGGRKVKLICHSPPSLTLPAEGREQAGNSGSYFEPVP